MNYLTSLATILIITAAGSMWAGYQAGVKDTVKKYESLPELPIDMLSLPHDGQPVVCHPMKVKDKPDDTRR